MNHPQQAEKFIENDERTNWHNESLWYIRKKRDIASKKLPEWETLRELASAIKSNVLSNLDKYLIQFEENALKNGIVVHWASDAKEHNEIVLHILKKSKADKLIKSKSMLTEECKLNEYLHHHGIEVIDSDLGERIVQLSQEPPSHIVLPAIHKKKEEVGELFHKTIGTEKGATDPQYLAGAARAHLRSHFLTASASLTGVNFAVAETGGIVVCTNEGNADMGVHLTPVHIASMGIEKIVPEQKHLGVFLRLLARSATGQPITVYSSHFYKPPKGAEMHLIIVDNGRTEQLERPDFRRSLHCIRCGACMNTCPVYRRSGGHSYGYTVPGPIGSILTPNIDMKKYASLPFASTLCGSCTDVCPVKIDIHEQLYKWRQIVAQEGYLPLSKRLTMKLSAYVLAHPRLYRMIGKSMRYFLKRLPKFMLYSKINIWGNSREIPKAPNQSFTEWYKSSKKNG